MQVERGASSLMKLGFSWTELEGEWKVPEEDLSVTDLEKEAGKDGRHDRCEFCDPDLFWPARHTTLLIVD
jgi:hypothetical protein